MPDHYMEGAESGFKVGWVVTYAPRNKNYGTAFYVSLLGSMEARGTPFLVTSQQSEALDNIEKFRQAFARVDATVQVGGTFSNAVTMLGEPLAKFTNDNGTIEAHFDYMPYGLEHIPIDWLTNGFTLLVSNEVIIQKAYSYTSSR